MSNYCFLRARQVALFCASLPISASVVHAATNTWTGGGVASTGWSTTTNWSPAAAPVSSANTSLLFAGTTSLTPNQNIVNPFTLNALTFDTTAGSFRLSGLSLDFVTSGTTAPTLTQNSANGQDIFTSLVLGNTLTVGGSGAGALTFAGAVSGAGQLIKTGSFNLVLGGGSADTTANTSTGAITASAGTITLDKASGAAAIAGDLFVAGIASIAATRGGLLGAGTNVTLNGSGLFSVGSSTFASLTVVASGGFGGGTFTLNTSATSALSLGAGIGVPNGIVITSPAAAGGITLLSNGSGSSSITGSIDLGGPSRTFSVPDNTNSSADDLTVSGVISDGALVKTGSGTLFLNNSNTYTLGTSILGGAVRIAADSALGSGGSLSLVGGTLQLSGSFNTARTITLGTGGGTIDTGGNTNTFSGFINNVGPLNKIGSGSLAIGGGSADTSANTNTGTVFVSAGTLTLDKAANTVAVAGDLDVLGGTVNINRAGQLSTAANVTLAGGTINFGPTTTFGSFTITPSATSFSNSTNQPFTFTSTSTALSVNFNAFGSFAYGVNLTGATGGSIVTNTPAGFVLPGPVNLGGVNRTINVTGSLSISGALSNGGINKTGPGTLLLTALQANTFTGPSTAAQGTLQLQDAGGVAIPGALTVNNGATVQLLANEQIAAAAPITINAATLNLGPFNTQTIATPITLGNATITGGTLNLNSDLNVTLAANTATLITSAINLNGAINLNDFSITSTTSTSLTGIIAGTGSLFFHGNSNVSVAGASSNTFTGGTNIDSFVYLDKTNGAIALPGPVNELSGILDIDGNNEIATSAALTVGSNASLYTGSFTQTVTTLNLNAFEFDGNLVIAPGGTGMIGASAEIGDALPSSLVNNGALTVNGPFFEEFTLTNNGSVTFTADTIGSGQFINNGTVTIQTGRTVAFNGVGVLNTGTLTFAGGTLKSTIGGYSLNNQNTVTGFGTVTGNGNFQNTGYISVTGGALSISVTGSAINAGNIDVQPTGQLQLAAALSNTGAINLLGGQITSLTGGSLSNTGSITGRGTISAPLTNFGALQPQGGVLSVSQNLTNNGLIIITPGSLLSGATLTNAAQIQGAGSISNFLINNGIIAPTGGTLAFTNFVSNNAGATLLVSSGNTADFLASFGSNAGLISLTGGAFIAPTSIVNSPTGIISGRGTFNAFALTNNGQIQLSAGISDIYGPVTSTSGSKITVSGGGTSTFYNDVTMNSGSIFQVSTNSTAVFFGNVHGTSFFTGPGVKDFEAGASSLGELSDPGSTQVQQPAVLTVSAIRESSLTVNGSATVLSSGNGGAVSTLSTLSIGPAGQFDLNDNDLILPYTGASPVSIIRGYLQSGYNNGSWNGTGIASSAGHMDTSHLVGLGYAEATDIGITRFDGQSVNSAVLVKYTYSGDSSLDGKVDLGNDFNLFLQGYLHNGASWELGDYNYDGVVNTADFNLFVDGYQSQGGSLGDLDAFISQSPLLSASQKSVLISVVPEPAAAAIAAITVPLALRRRRRCSHFA